MKPFSNAVIGLVALLGAPACTVVSSSQAASEMAQAYCDKLDACSGGTEVARIYGDPGTCVARWTQFYRARLAAPDTGASPLDLQDCSRAFPAWDCDAWRLDNQRPAACVEFGPADDGAPCVTDAQCAGGSCVIPLDGTCGTCGTALGVDDDCSMLPCGAGLYCTTDGICAAPLAQGQTCSSGAPCDPGLACVRPTAADTMGVCQPVGRSVGTVCGYGSVGAPGCDTVFGLFCDSVSGTCQASSLANAGEPCGRSHDGSTNIVCANNGFCTATSPGAAASTCVAAAAEGEACDNSAGPRCAPPARCVLNVAASGLTAGTCRAFASNACD